MNKIILSVISIVCVPFVMWSVVLVNRFYEWFGGIILISPDSSDLSMFGTAGVFLTVFSIVLAVGILLPDEK